MESDGRVAEEDEKKPAISRTSSQQQKYDAKATKILEACKWKDVHTLRALATTEGGLLSDDLRRQACSYDREISVDKY